MRVELLFAEDDPGYMAARQNLVEVLTEDAFETPIQMIPVTSQADAQLLGFPGSPTIRLDGQDIDPAAPGRISLDRRTYAGEDGAASHVPGKELIRRAVARARGWSHPER
jgi:hypothetical protein